MAYRFKNVDSNWSEPANTLEGDTTEKDGFVALALGKENSIYAMWLDMRLAKKNNIFSSISPMAVKPGLKAL